MLVEVCTEHWKSYCLLVLFRIRHGNGYMWKLNALKWQYLFGMAWVEGWGGGRNQGGGWHHYVMKNIGLFTYPLVQRGHLKNVCWPLTVTTLQTVLTEGLFGPLWKLQWLPISIYTEFKTSKGPIEIFPNLFKTFHPNSTIHWRQSEFLVMHLTTQRVFL